MKGLEICVKAVIPSVFPAAILGSLLSRAQPPRFLAKPVSRIFGMSEDCACAVTAGMFSGFPTGALCTVGLLKSGRISRDDAERLICFVSSPSAAFVAGSVGAYMLHSIRAGIALVLIQLFTNFAIGVYLGRRRDRSYECARSVGVKSLSARDFTDSVKDAALAMLNVSAFVTAFSVVCGFALEFIKNPYISALICGALELGNGVSALSSLDLSVGTRFLIAGIFVGWSGISAQMQVLAVCADSGISMKKYFLSRVVSCVITGCICALLLRFTSGSFIA